MPLRFQAHKPAPDHDPGIAPENEVYEKSPSSGQSYTFESAFV